MTSVKAKPIYLVKGPHGFYRESGKPDSPEANEYTLKNVLYFGTSDRFVKFTLEPDARVQFQTFEGDNVSLYVDRDCKVVKIETFTGNAPETELVVVALDPNSGLWDLLYDDYSRRRGV